jgi:hypothetical protein
VRGKEILRDLPATTKFKSYESQPGSKTVAYYNTREDTIYIPASYTSLQAAPTAAHEAIHAIQEKTEPRAGKVRMVEQEVEAKHAGLDVYEQLGRPAVPYQAEAESRFREGDRAKYEELVRRHYRGVYHVPEPSPSPSAAAGPGQE